jgi:ABC-type transporter Mla subunit MlaD
MRRKEHNELVAGLFVTVTLAATIGVVIWLGAAEVFRPKAGEAVFCVRESAGSLGLKVGNFVQVTDQVIGKIADIRLAPDRQITLYVARLDRADLKVYSNGKATVAAGLVGDRQLVITSRGTADHPPADTEHPVEISGGLDQAMASIATAAENLKGISEIVRRELAADVAGSLLAKIHAVSDSLKSAAGDVAKITGNLRPEMDPANSDSILAKFKQTATSVAKTAERIEGYSKTEVAEILAKLRDVNTEVLKIASDFSEVSHTARELVTLNRENIDEIIDNMTQVSVSLKSASKEIRRSPWRLLYKPKPDEMHSQNVYDAARAFSDGAEQLDQAIARLKALPPEAASSDPQVQRIHKQLQQTFSDFAAAEQALWRELAK